MECVETTVILVRYEQLQEWIQVRLKQDELMGKRNGAPDMIFGTVKESDEERLRNVMNLDSIVANLNVKSFTR